MNFGFEGKVDMVEMVWMINDLDMFFYLVLCIEVWLDKGGFNFGYYFNLEVDKFLEVVCVLID